MGGGPWPPDPRGAMPMVCMSAILNVSGHQGRTQSEPQVSVPLISQPVVSYRGGGTTPLQGVRLGYLGLFFILGFCSHVRVINSLFLCHVSTSRWKGTHGIWWILHVLVIYCALHAVDREILSR